MSSEQSTVQHPRDSPVTTVDLTGDDPQDSTRDMAHIDGRLGASYTVTTTVQQQANTLDMGRDDGGPKYTVSTLAFLSVEQIKNAARSSETSDEMRHLRTLVASLLCYA